MSANLYASVAEFKDRLCVTGDDRDFAIDRYLQSASRWIDRVTGRRFYINSSPEVRFYTASECFWELAIDDTLSLTELATDANGDGVYETIWTQDTDYFLAPRNAVVDAEPYRFIQKAWWTGRFSLPAYPDAVKLTGTFGYCTLANVPPEIRELCLMVAESDARPILDMAIPGVRSYRIGADMSIIMEGKEIPARAKTIIEQYARKVYVF